MSDAQLSPSVSLDSGRLRSRYLKLMQHTLEIITHIVAPLGQETATTLRDRRDGPRAGTSCRCSAICATMTTSFACVPIGVLRFKF